MKKLFILLTHEKLSFWGLWWACYETIIFQHNNILFQYLYALGEKKVKE